MLNLNDLALFVTAVEQGGFAAGGRHLGLPRSTLSKRVALLEDQLQVRLLQRSSRRFALTEIGQEFFERARAALSEVEAAETIVRGRQAEPSGTVRISASIPVVQGPLAACLPALARRYPRLRIEVEASDRFIDLAQEGIDIAVRSHFGPLPDSGLVQRSLGSERIVLVASPAYLASAPALDTPEQLRMHAGLLTARHATRWTLHNAGARTVLAEPQVAMVGNESQLLIAAAEAGLGVTVLPCSLCAPAIAAGRLQQVLPAWHAGEVTTTVLLPHRRGQLPGVRVVVDALVAHYALTAAPVPAPARSVGPGTARR
ncbi:LysR substrate-binding domain-containing protein [Stenotrophomonas maltophilia]|uniref:LysR family transcriptional regulator n=1 Tax=Stenotrophomonas maltophilia TaxID=40324 RepID=A0A2W6KNC4_STEMA|nr:LysR substrate-binding domain-containing protein [Stenotrophomonas maltophilia]PSM13919.1 LysR family transcriptional regulator [Stenotrophomonas maltophilia]PZS96822.1 LysR family transcriptional regulator [Stenotrophomonas maltophilia]